MSNVFEYMSELAARAKAAAVRLATADTAGKNAALRAAAAALRENCAAILKANEKDLSAGRESGMSEALLDRLALNASRIEGMAQGMEQVASLPDPVGIILEERTLPNGLLIRRESVPFGVLGVIYEARPNVTADSAALALKSGSAVILRGGKEAFNSNLAVAETIRKSLESSSLPADCLVLVEDLSRESANVMMTMRGAIDLLIPRGGAGLINAVVDNSKVPVLQTGAGVCHTYVDKSADIEKACNIIVNAKASRPSVCNACECLLLDKAAPSDFAPKLFAALSAAGVEVLAESELLSQMPGAKPAAESDFGREFGALTIAAKYVDGVLGAVEHINKYGTMHSECIVTEDESAADVFMALVDAAAVYHNASTRFTDGGEFGLGAEIGISTQKLHARGPLGLREIVTYKYKVYGSGQIR